MVLLREWRMSYARARELAFHLSGNRFERFHELFTDIYEESLDDSWLDTSFIEKEIDKHLLAIQHLQYFRKNKKLSVIEGFNRDHHYPWLFSQKMLENIHTSSSQEETLLFFQSLDYIRQCRCMKLTTQIDFDLLNSFILEHEKAIDILQKQKNKIRLLGLFK